MKGRTFFDANILVYCYSTDDPSKQQIATKLASSNEAFISAQVIQELCNTLRKKFKLEWMVIIPVIEEIQVNFEVHINTQETMRSACQLAANLKFSFYDSLIIAAALEAGCETLYSEDLRHGQLIEGKLKIENPFL